MRSDSDIVVIEHPDDWKHEMFTGVAADPIAERTNEHGVVRVRCRTSNTMPDARIVVESHLIWLPETIRFGVEFEDDDE